MTRAHQPKHDPFSDAQACIVWHPADRAPAPELLRALANKGLALIDADDPHTAFAAACSVAQTARRTILVLEASDQLSDIDSVCSALERFAPSVLCWAHHPGANPPLVPLVQPKASTPQRPKPAPATEPAAASKGTPATPLRLVGRREESPETTPEPIHTKTHDKTHDQEQAQQPKAPQLQQPPQVQHAKQAALLSSRDVLDADELDALLADELGDRKR